MEKRKNRKETDIIRKMYKYFKSGKGEIAFFISLYQLYLLFELSGNEAIIRVIFVTILLGITGLVIGYVSIKKLDTTSPYVMPYTQDYIRKDTLELIAEREFIYSLMCGDDEIKKEHYDNIIKLLDYAIKIREKWLDEPIEY